MKLNLSKNETTEIGSGQDYIKTSVYDGKSVKEVKTAENKHREIHNLEDYFGPIEVVKNHKSSELHLVSQVKLEENDEIRERMLKILRKPSGISVNDYKDIGKRFEREAVYGEILSSNNNSFISVLDFSIEPVPFMLMEYAAGGSLRDRIGAPKDSRAKNNYQYNMKDVMGWMLYVSKALDFAHSIRLVHRDIKPENILITAKEQVRVADPGIMRTLERWNYEIENKFIGTPVYASPEQFEGVQEDIDNQTDIYSLGLVMCELLTGTNPLNPKAVNLNQLGKEQALMYLKSNGQNIQDIIKGKFDDVLSIREQVPGISGGLVKIIEKSLEPDKKKRYPSFENFIYDLKRTDEYRRAELHR
ncbi:protein kinase [Candidatus Woesearchaeota archaeon]|nr:protein kinase [Candidatus Woesearchaeota archaeon]